MGMVYLPTCFLVEFYGKLYSRLIYKRPMDAMGMIFGKISGRHRIHGTFVDLSN